MATDHDVSSSVVKVLNTILEMELAGVFAIALCVDGIWL